MSSDRFVYFDTKKPTREEIRLLLEDFFAGGGVVSSEHLEDQGRYYITLPGESSFPFRRIADRNPYGDLWADVKERWIEVYVDSLDRDMVQEDTDELRPCIDVITRMADEYTCILADGFAKIVARYWQGEYV